MKGTKQADYSVVTNSWNWWITIATQRTHYLCPVRLTSMPGYVNRSVSSWLLHLTLTRLLHSAKVIVMYSFFLWHYWSPFLSKCGEMYSNCQCTAVQSQAANISVKQKWVTLSAQFRLQQDGTTTHTAHFYTSAQDMVSGQIHFSFQGHHLAHPSVWSCSTKLLPLWLCQKKGTCPANTNDLKLKIQECKAFMGPLIATTYYNLSITTASV